jgi:hypothetical protein
MTSHISKRKTGFQLPPDVSYAKQRLPDAWAYVFRHRVLGELGRILLQELDDGRCHISCEVVGDPSDPMTTQRTAIFKPLGLELTRQMEAAFGATPEEAGPVDPPRRPPETKEVIESKIIPCERCRAVLAMLIFAPKATDPSASTIWRGALRRPRSIREGRTPLPAVRLPQDGPCFVAGARSFRAEGRNCDDHILSLTTPLMRKHLNPFGRYYFDLNRMRRLPAENLR